LKKDQRHQERINVNCFDFYIFFYLFCWKSWVEKSQST